jgi:hypothetical protein
MKKYVLMMFLFLLWQSGGVHGQLMPITDGKKTINDSDSSRKVAIRIARYNRFVSEAKEQDKTPLHYVIDLIATVKNISELFMIIDSIEDIVRKNAALTHGRINRKFPIMYAFEKYHDKRFVVPLVNVLLILGADPNSCDEKGWSLLHHAVRKNNIELVKLLIKRYSANVNQATAIFRITPLHLACALGRSDIFDVLIDNKANANLTTSSGATAVHYVAGLGLNAGFSGGELNLEPFIKSQTETAEEKENYEKQIVIRTHMLKRLIVDCRVSCFTLKDEQGLSAYNYAEKYGHDNLCTFMFSDGEEETWCGYI